MARNVWKSIKKCVIEGEDEQGGGNEQTLNHSVTNSDVDLGSNETKLTDVIDDCVDRILLYLSIDDLLAIARTNTRLRLGARRVFAQKFGNMEIICNIRGLKPLRKNGGNFCINGRNPGDNFMVFVSNLLTVFRCLRCFGQLIIRIHYRSACKQLFTMNLNRELLNYANEYCSESLTRFSCEFFTTNDFETAELKKPFLNVQSVYFQYCDINYKAIQWNTLFRAMRNLNLSFNEKNPDAIALMMEEDFPHLDHFRIAVHHSEQYDKDLMGLWQSVRRKWFNSCFKK